MAVMEDAEHDLPPKKKPPTEDEKRMKKIVAGTLMKALMRSGGGEATPSDGDQVMYHCTVRTLDGVIVESTRSEYRGKGIPVRHVLGKSKMLLGLLEGIPTMQKGEVAMAVGGDFGVVKKVTRITGAEADSPYDIVGVNSNMSLENIKKRYWKLSLWVHPDKCSHPDAHQAFIKLNKTFKELQDPDKETNYL